MAPRISYVTSKAIVLCAVSFCGLFRPVHGHGDGSHGNYKLLVVSFDGFRWDYLQQTETPNFDRIVRNGVKARYGLKNTFLTTTLPNQFTLATGLFEESHGIVGGNMYDPDLNETFELSSESQEAASRWYDVGAEPIWVTNQLQKEKEEGGRSACMMWVGCEASIKGVTPTYHVPYRADVPNETRIDLTVGWLKGPDPANLGLIYFQEPDETAHEFGPDSAEVTAMIAGMDKVVGYLLDKLEEAGLLENTNLIITSDHGFASTSPDRVVNLDDFIRPDTYNLTTVSPVAGIIPHEGLLEEIFSNLSAGAEKNPNFQVYQKETIPEEYHYKHHLRITPILVVAEENFSIVFNHSAVTEKGSHGYNNSLQTMHPFFVAMGPGFVPGVEVDSFCSVDVYPLMCHLLGLTPAPNNGSLHALVPLLQDRGVGQPASEATLGVYFLILLVTSGVGLVFVMVVCQQYWRKQRKQRGRMIVMMEGGMKSSLPPVSEPAQVPLLSEANEEESFQ